MKNLISALLVYSLIVPTGFAFAAEPAAVTDATSRTTPGIQASALRAAQGMTLQATPAATSGQAFPRTMPRSGKRFNQGGGMGAGMMVMSLIGTVAGVAGTYYMVKMMKDQNNEAK